MYAYDKIKVVKESEGMNMKKHTITEYMAEELAYETGKTFEEICKEYNVVDVNDYCNHGEDTF